MSQSQKTAESLYDLEVKTIDGAAKRLADYQGKVLLIVNTASECGYTPQYEGLEALHQKYKSQGLAVLGFPANEFGAQEPGTDAQIKSFCSTRFHVSFDLFSKIVVKGAGMHPLYRRLTSAPGLEGEIPWNFAKFLVDRHGKPAARFTPDDEPLSAGLTAKIEELLAAR